MTASSTDKKDKKPSKDGERPYEKLIRIFSGNYGPRYTQVSDFLSLVRDGKKLHAKMIREMKRDGLID